MIFRVLDLESIADESVWTHGEPTYKMVPAEVPGMIDLRAGDPVPPPYACRVVALSWVDVGMDPARLGRYYFDRCYSECLWDVSGSPGRADAAEYKMLAAFAAAMAMTPVPTLVTWNGRTFDLPVLSMRSFKHRIPFAWYYAERNVRYRYSDEGHLDLMDSLSDYGACRFMRLSDVARLCGLPGKTDMSGDKVADQYALACREPARSDEIADRVRRYCLQDSLQTAIIFLRRCFHLGKVDAEGHNIALGTFRASPSVTEAIDLDWDRLLL